MTNSTVSAKCNGRVLLEPVLYKKTSPPDTVANDNPTDKEPVILDYNVGQGLTLDDLLLSFPNLSMQKMIDNIHIKSEELHELVKKLRTSSKPKKNPACYCFSPADIDELDEVFKIPNIIEEKDLFAKYWPKKNQSDYLKSRSKMFYFYSKNYHQSIPSKNYGGAAEWIYLTTGSLEFNLYRPTDANLLRFQPDGTFSPEPGTKLERTMKPGDLLTIPAGYIITRKASVDSYALAGHFYDLKDIATQLISFDQDVSDYNGRFSTERDGDIRSLYWFALARLMTYNLTKEVLNEIDCYNLNIWRKSCLE